MGIEEISKKEISKDAWITEAKELMKAYVAAWDQLDEPDQFMREMVMMRIACRYILEKYVIVELPEGRPAWGMNRDC